MEKQINKPSLRFPEFNGEWEKKKFGEVTTNKSGKFNPEKETESVKCIELEHLASGTSQLLGYIDGKNSGSIKNKFQKGDVLFGKLRPYLKKYLLAPFDGVCSSEIWVLNGMNISNDFLFRIVQTDVFIDLANQSSGSKMPRADWNVVENGIFSIPTLPEQQKIAAFLTTIDEKLKALKKKKNLLEAYKKGVMQKLFSQELRFKDENVNNFPDWVEKKLGEVIDEKTEKSKISGQHRILSSTAKGLFNQDEYFTRDIASTDNSGYKIIRKFQLVFSPQNLWLGNINVNMDFEIGIVSPSYKIFSFIEKHTSAMYCQYFLLTPKMMFEYEQSSVQGASVVRRNLDMDKFLNIEIPLPCLEEQAKIANFLSTIDEKINYCQAQITNIEVWKKGLLQKMFV